MNRASQRGITLLEIMIAVVIMITMTALALPSLTKFSESMSLRSAAVRISTMMRLAQRYAITYNAIYRVDIYPDQNWAGIYSNDSGGALIGKLYLPPNLINIATTTINGTGSADMIDKGSILFSPKGTASPAANIHLVRTNSFFSNTEDPFGVSVSSPITYYQPGYNYSAVSSDEKEMCYTLAVDSSTGRVKLHKTGVGGPWD
ncbi:MAG: hypothetical protein C4541_06045 [Candidatus Auribacter fodinae]|jgi:Tfp pilus assembly protein FimT|uniref:Prepilin-type N-terminal cleavage/methylation domain-containing protein n=1 Tax=Candidatus Auribacter fodinae TaxID=2093366 RepID=A0A3A4R379_9BACT|nr:MAG: hypothetical protein C4541_06045 [Candidatus Auribacter fodinae]